MTVGDARRARDDAHHLGRDSAEVLARLLVGDLVELAEIPLAGEACRLGLQVGRRVPGQARRLVRLGLGHRRVEVVVDEETPDVLVGVMADELDDVDAAIAELTALAIGLGDLGLDRDDALEPGLEIAHSAEESTGRPSRWRAGKVDAMAHRVTLVPGDGTGPELTEATRRVLEATGVEFDWDVKEAGRRRDGVRRHAAARRHARLDPRQQGRAQRPDHDADRHGLPLGQRRAPPRARALRLPAAVQDVSRRALALRVRRRRHRPREHGRSLRGHRVHVRKRRRAPRDRHAERPAAEAHRRVVGPVDQADQPGRLGADHPLRLRVREEARPPGGALHHEGEHHEAHGRPLPLRLPRGRRRTIRTSRRARTSSTRSAWASSSGRRSSTCSCCRTSTATSSAT